MRLTIGLVALTLAAPAFAQEEEIVEEEVITDPEMLGKEEIPEEVIIEEAIGALPAGKLSRAERDEPAVFVRLGDGGRVQVKNGEDWKDASLDGFSTWLRIAMKEHDEAMRAKGGSGLEVVGGGVKASQLFVSIEAAPDTPWQHLQWLMVVAAEQKYYKLELSDGRRRMLALLPVDRGIEWIPGKAPAEIKVGIHLVARAEVEAKWGDATVMRPTKIAYRFGDRETQDVGAVGEWITAAKKAVGGAKDISVVGEIRAGHKVPFARVFDLMEAYVDKGVPAVNFYGTQIPSQELRAAPRLPFPAHNYAR